MGRRGRRKMKKKTKKKRKGEERKDVGGFLDDWGDLK